MAIIIEVPESAVRTNGDPNTTVIYHWGDRGVWAEYRDGLTPAALAFSFLSPAMQDRELEKLDRAYSEEDAITMTEFEID